MVNSMMDILPSTLLAVFIIAIILMTLASYSSYKVFQIASEAFLVIYNTDTELYKIILGDRDISWLERKTHSITDFSLWWKFYRLLYSDKRIEEIIGDKLTNKYVFYFRISLAFSVISILLGVSVITIGFVLASNN